MAAAAPIPTAPLKVLVIDDNDADIMLLHLILDGLEDQLELHSARNAAEACRYLESLIPDLILLDLNMPGRDGFELLTTFKSVPQWRDIPVVMFTDSNVDAEIRRAYQMGASGYLPKPMDLGELRRRMTSLIEIFRKR